MGSIAALSGRSCHGAGQTPVKEVHNLHTSWGARFARLPMGKREENSLPCDLPLFAQLIQLRSVMTLPFIENCSIYCGKNPAV